VTAESGESFSAKGLVLPPTALPFDDHRTVTFIVFEFPDPGFWQVNESVAADLTSDADMATVT
jgi:hypothetical protein